jgi:hypothetical protein
MDDKWPIIHNQYNKTMQSMLEKLIIAISDNRNPLDGRGVLQ